MNKSVEVGVSVAIRVRPFNERELRNGGVETSLLIEGNSLVTRTTPSNQFNFGFFI